jgi:hypothetical protein
MSGQITEMTGPNNRNREQITEMSGTSFGRSGEEGRKAERQKGRKAGQHRPMRRTGLKVGDQATLSQNSS